MLPSCGMLSEGPECSKCFTWIMLLSPLKNSMRQIQSVSSFNKPKHRGTKSFFQAHIAGKWQEQDSNPIFFIIQLYRLLVQRHGVSVQHNGMEFQCSTGGKKEGRKEWLPAEHHDSQHVIMQKALEKDPKALYPKNDS